MNEDVMTAVCNIRILGCGNRHLIFSDPTAVVDEEGNIAYGNLIYSAECIGDKTTVTHRPTKATVIIDDCDSKWQIRSPWDDFNAELFLSKIRRFKIAPLFGKQEGPNTVEMWRGTCEALQLSAATQLGNLKEKKRASTTEDKAKIANDFNTPSKEERATHTARAREVLAQRAQATDKRRRVSVKASQPPVAAPAIDWSYCIRASLAVACSFRKFSLAASGFDAISIIASILAHRSGK